MVELRGSQPRRDRRGARRLGRWAPIRRRSPVTPGTRCRRPCFRPAGSCRVAPADSGGRPPCGGRQRPRRRAGAGPVDSPTTSSVGRRTDRGGRPATADSRRRAASSPWPKRSCCTVVSVGPRARRLVDAVEARHRQVARDDDPEVGGLLQHAQRQDVRDAEDRRRPRGAGWRRAGRQPRGDPRAGRCSGLRRPRPTRRRRQRSSSARKPWTRRRNPPCRVASAADCGAEPYGLRR